MDIFFAFAVVFSMFSFVVALILLLIKSKRRLGIRLLLGSIGVFVFATFGFAMTLADLEIVFWRLSFFGFLSLIAWRLFKKRKKPASLKEQEQSLSRKAVASLRQPDTSPPREGGSISHRISKRMKFEIEYYNADGEVSERIIIPSSVRKKQSSIYLIWAYCEMRKESRTFRNDRILKCIEVESKKKIKNLGKYLYDNY